MNRPHVSDEAVEALSDDNPGLLRLAEACYEDGRKKVSGRPPWKKLNPNEPYEVGMRDHAFVEARALLAALSLPHPAGWARVKPLEWIYSSWGVNFTAQTQIGEYSVTEYTEITTGRGWQSIRDDNDELGYFATVDEAKAAAQRDYETRIRSALSTPAPQPVAGERERALEDIAAERQRQVSAEGWSAEHDDTHVYGEIAAAAATYAYYNSAAYDSQPAAESLWPQSWDSSWWKPTNARRDLVKAGALIVAEIERLDRALASTATSSEAVPQPSGGEGEEGR